MLYEITFFHYYNLWWIQLSIYKTEQLKWSIFLDMYKHEEFFFSHFASEFLLWNWNTPLLYCNV